jgi:hypothetical protein
MTDTLTTNQGVVGSNPAGRASKTKAYSDVGLLFLGRANAGMVLAGRPRVFLPIRGNGHWWELNAPEGVPTLGPALNLVLGALLALVASRRLTSH